MRQTKKLGKQENNMKYMFRYLLAKKQRIPGMKIFTTMDRRTAKAVHSNNYGA